MKKTTRGATLLMLAVACAADGRGPAARATVSSASTAPVVSAAPAVSVEPPPAPKPPLAELIDKTLTDTEAAWLAHDGKKLAAAYATDVELRITLPTDAWSPLKKSAVEAQLAQLFAAVADGRVTTTRTLRKGNVVVAEGYFTGSVGGKKVGCPVVSLSWFDDAGLVKSQHAVFDPGTILGQLGKGGPKTKVRAVEPIPTAPIVNVIGGAAPDEARNLEAVKAHYASNASAKTWTTGEPWGVGSFVVVEISVGSVHGVDVFEVQDGKVKVSTSYGPPR
jgi:ketosteroid isomerase-like protein